jgi:hypothetical protein
MLGYDKPATQARLCCEKMFSSAARTTYPSVLALTLPWSRLVGASPIFVRCAVVRRV